MKLCIFDLDGTLYDTSDRLDEVTPNFATMKVFSDASQILQNTSVTKILVTHGEKERQEKKIETLGVRNYFKEIFICGDKEEKRGLFEKILAQYGIEDPKEVVVVGDRIDNEIRFGNMLGCVTVYFKHGKYTTLKPKDELDIPTHTIISLAELATIFES